MNDEWELDKENIKPCKKGHNVDTINEVLKVSSKSAKLDYLEQQKMYNLFILFAKIDFMKMKQKNTMELIHQLLGYRIHLFKLYISYIKWIRDSYVSGSESPLRSVIENCVNRFLPCEQYRNDDRYISLCVEYADLEQDPEPIFEFLDSNGIGSESGFFAIAKAVVNEEKKNYIESDRIYRDAIKRLLPPQNTVKLSYSEFLRRIRRSIINYCKERIALGKPVINELLEIEKQEPNIYNKNVKKAIHVLTAHEANKNPNKKGLMPSNINNKPIIKLNNNYNNNNNKEFRIYHDDENENINMRNNKMMMVMEEDGEGEEMVENSNKLINNNNWNNLYSHEERTKENIISKSKWNDIKIVQNKVKPEKKCSFQIYNDEENDDTLKTNNIRRKLEYTTEYNTSNRRTNGLEEEDDDDDMTVNTKKALEELSDLYSTPSWCLKKPPKPFITPHPNNNNRDCNKELLKKLSSEVLQRVEKR